MKSAYHFDLAILMLYLFWIAFAALLFYIRREDRREGYPLFNENSNSYKTGDFLFIPPPKTFSLPHGGSVVAPNGKVDDRDHRLDRTSPWSGSPYEPAGDPMLAGVGPGSYAERANTPDMTIEGHAKIVPMRVATTFSIASGDPDPRGMTVVGADGRAAGAVRDVWVDRSETLIRYLEVELAGGAKSVLLPMTFASIDKRQGNVKVNAILSGQFAQVPALAGANQVTLLEEDKICAYYGAGTLYAEPKRKEPLL